jgi:uncharacterized protein YjeT (DUF2065 family)
MPREIWVGLCLMVVFEGLLLFAVPQAWQRMALEMSQMDPRRLRAGGGIAIIVGLLLLQFAL